MSFLCFDRQHESSIETIPVRLQYQDAEDARL